MFFVNVNLVGIIYITVGIHVFLFFIFFGITRYPVRMFLFQSVILMSMFLGRQGLHCMLYLQVWNFWAGCVLFLWEQYKSERPKRQDVDGSFVSAGLLRTPWELGWAKETLYRLFMVTRIKPVNHHPDIQLTNYKTRIYQEGENSPETYLIELTNKIKFMTSSVKKEARFALDSMYFQYLQGSILQWIYSHALTYICGRILCHLSRWFLTTPSLILGKIGIWEREWVCFP